MLFPLGAWCPSLGKKGKGKEVGHQGNRLYSYSTYVPYITYVLKSIHKRCSPVFLVAAMHSAAEKAHSRKPVFIHPHRHTGSGLLSGLRSFSVLSNLVDAPDEA